MHRLRTLGSGRVYTEASAEANCGCGVARDPEQSGEPPRVWRARRAEVDVRE